MEINVQKNFTDRIERNKGTRSPFEDNENCSQHCGIFIGENKIGRPTLIILFEEVEDMKSNNLGFEFKCKNPRQEFIDKYHQFKLERNKEYRIDVKTAHLIDGHWQFNIHFNNTTDYFLPIVLNEENMHLYM